MAEQVYLKDGTVVDGTIVQQNRTTIQIRTATGLKTIAKEAIKKIDYAKGPSLEEKHAERERQKETERKREVEKAKDSERQKEMKVDVEAKSDLPSSVPERKKRWWIEPTISRGQGRFRSHLETVHRRLQTDLQILFRDDVYGMYAPEGQWRYDVSSHQSLTLRTGWDDWVLEVESVRHITQVKSWQYHSGQPHVAGSDTVFDYLFYNQMEGLREETLFWRVGYLFYKAKGISLTGFIGRRTLSGDATYSYVGQSRSLFPDGSEAFESILPVPSSLKSDGQGPEVGIEASLPMEKLTFVGRLSGYTQDIRSRVQEMFISSDDVSSVLSAVSESHRFNAKGSDVSLRVVYRIVYDVDVFLGYQVSQSQWEVRKVQDAYAFSYFQAFDEWSLFPPERAFAAQSLAPHLDRHMPGGSSRLVHVGISRRFWF